ncbi:uncharacterized protein BDW70DRAFT_140664 [Aspergillus foveolatus]|uniref:uncharacterized protein n=1 Tax=Aspergillus foveolatus TaxID=210207 RepID=UPI003CCD5702
MSSLPLVNGLRTRNSPRLRVRALALHAWAEFTVQRLGAFPPAVRHGLCISLVSKGTVADFIGQLEDPPLALPARCGRHIAHAQFDNDLSTGLLSLCGMGGEVCRSR